MSLTNGLNHPKMKQDLFRNLPSDIVIDILSRLPVRSVISCKCVQKSWLHLVETREFVKSHLSKSTPGVIICQNPSRESNLEYKFYEIQDGFDVEHHDLHYRLVTKFTLLNDGWKMGSADGLLFLVKRSASETKPDAFCICNPITRDYINLDCPPEFGDSYHQLAGYGFGSSKMTKQYKVVSIFHDRKFNQETRQWQNSPEAEFFVYTLGTSSWRRYASRTLLQYKCVGPGASVKGNLHWLACDFGRGPNFLRIFCFDLETEQYSAFFAPPFPWNGKSPRLFALKLFVWGDCLCLTDCSSVDEIIIWMMKEYGDEKSWTKELVLSNDLKLLGRVYPIKVFKNGDVLFQLNGFFLFYYSIKTKTTQRVTMLTLPGENRMQAIIHTPSFLSLKSLGLNVSSF